METVVREKRHRSRSSLREGHEWGSELKTVSSISPRQATTPIKDQATRGRPTCRSRQKHKRVTGKPQPAALHSISPEIVLSRIILPRYYPPARNSQLPPALLSSLQHFSTLDIKARKDAERNENDAVRNEDDAVRTKIR